MPLPLPDDEKRHSVSVSIPGRYVRYLRDHNVSISELVNRAIAVEKTREYVGSISPPLLLTGVGYLLLLLSPVLLSGSYRLVSAGFSLCLFLVGVTLLGLTLWRHIKLSHYTPKSR